MHGGDLARFGEEAPPIDVVPVKMLYLLVLNFLMLYLVPVVPVTGKKINFVKHAVLLIIRACIVHHLFFASLSVI